MLQVAAPVGSAGLAVCSPDDTIAVRESTGRAVRHLAALGLVVVSELAEVRLRDGRPWRYLVTGVARTEAGEELLRQLAS